MQSVLLLKLFVSLFLSVAAFIVYRYRAIAEEKLSGQPTFSFFVAWGMLRLLPIVIIYVVLGQEARSDVPMFYNWASAAKQALLVYRDFDSPYAPFFSYTTALPLFLWDTPNALVFLMAFAEGIVLWLQLTIQTHNQQTISTTLWEIIIYLLLPLPFVMVVLSGQEDIWMWGFCLAALWSWQRKHDELLIGIWMGLALLFTKVLFILVIPGVFFILKRKVRFVLGMAAVGLPVLLWLVAVSGDAFLLPIKQAADPRTPNIWTILNPFTAILIKSNIPTLNTLGLFLLIATSSLIGLRLRKVSFSVALPTLWILVYGVMMIVQQSSLSNYAFIYMLPLVSICLNNWQLKHFVILLIFNCLLVVQPPIWWGLNMPLFDQLSDLAIPINLLEYLLEILIIGTIVYFCNLVWKQATTAL
ncbi:MAG: hypothetical protein U0Y10_18855 [Spirosomataceae bacterium]